MSILESLVSLATKLFSALGTAAKASPCGGFFDEPEVPAELTELHK
ncbi:cyclic lactone autoinducer peptide [Staphylococcus gallinarum]|uniref:Cyclic lactone autoinducer peptide n=1 Tax=Staphylococcus gallinarum TaxID=1293 RepID=A0A418HLR5_STAGA|nr:cyclic lactone autoinducer peptide [Staphylococcus gallinarum]MCD8827505.1 cyclic lactone autoinducer peptide [Staphylococcus gallinarum]MCD8900892.1 cyclic lactone autoinducer peptide [Staphylococcus gallinarum]MCD8903645.1 cyclic lactone autoinducer peptide [Staphylococcus gallinarum]MEB6238416.1 cyclic lactone autoinducer peptide [Staphylococcus gallinarum]PTE74239.1 cyclic lactone autoinducer peptide [Staphylococcus gallinarum]